MELVDNGTIHIQWVEHMSIKKAYDIMIANNIKYHFCSWADDQVDTISYSFMKKLLDNITDTCTKDMEELFVYKFPNGEECGYIIVNKKTYDIIETRELFKELIPIKYDDSDQNYVCMANFIKMDEGHYSINIFGQIHYVKRNGIIMIRRIMVDYEHDVINHMTPKEDILEINRVVKECIELFNRNSHNFNQYNPIFKTKSDDKYEKIYTFEEVDIDLKYECCIFKNTADNVDQFLYVFKYDKLVLEVLGDKDGKFTDTDPIPELFKTNHSYILNKSILN